MKAAPIHNAFRAAGIPHELVHTGQHYDEAMSKVFFEDLGMPRPVVDLEVGSGSHAQQTGAVMVGLEKFFGESKPKAVLVVGDVNSTMAASIVCAKMGINVAHVEAGLRSGDWRMPEEVNRVVTDSICDLLLTPSADADENLRKEGCEESSIVRVGNVMIDTLMAHLPKARELAIPKRYGVESGRYAVLTLHRPSNVDDPVVFGRILGAIVKISRELPIVFPVHPRTRKQAASFGFGSLLENTPGLVVCDPLGYLEFLSLSSAARLALTDSGGLQEETTALGIPCITMRENTERPVTVTEGTNVLVGTDDVAILSEAHKALLGGKTGRIPELWDGKTADRIVSALKHWV